jgi:hypothetical protein
MAILTKGTTFADGDQVTSTKLNNLVDAAVFASGAVDDATIQLSSGQLAVKTINTGQIANNAITTAKIADSTGASDGVTTAKLATGSITTAKIADANVTPAKLSQPFTVETAKAQFSLSIDFTSIPSWVRRITVILNEVSVNGSSNLLIQLGDSGGVETTGYVGSSVIAGDAVASSGDAFTTGIGLILGASSNTLSGIVQICNVSSNLWVAAGSYGYTGIGYSGSTGSSKTLSGTLDRVRITTSNGTDLFDNGSMNIMYE